MNKPKSQNLRILEHLKKGRSITAEYAMEKFRCFRLAARISEIRDHGVDIEMKIIVSGRSRYASYSLK